MTDDERDDQRTPGEGGGDSRPQRPSGGGFGDRGRGGPGGGRPFGDRGFSRGGSGGGGRPFNSGGGSPRPYNAGGGGGGRPYSGSGGRPYSGSGGGRPSFGGPRPFSPGAQGRPYSGGGQGRPGGEGGDRPWSRDRGDAGDQGRRERPSFDRGDRGGFDRGGFDRGDNRPRGNFGGGGFDRGDNRPRGNFGGGSGGPGGRPYGDRPQGDRPSRPYNNRPDRPDRPPRRFENDRPRESFSPDRSTGGADRSLGSRSGSWQDRSDRGERPERVDQGAPQGRGDQAERERLAWSGERPAYRSGPRTGDRPAWRPDRRDERPERSGWQNRGGSDAPADGGPDVGLARPELLAADEDLVAGRRPVAEAFAARRPAKRLLVVPERRQALEQLVLHATALRIPVVEVEGGTLTSVSGFDGHQGIALVVEPRRWATLNDVLARAKERGEPPLILVLDSLQDPQNVGTLLRTAEANGVHGVIFPTRNSAPISPAAVKTSAGATEHLLLVPLDDFAGGLVDLRSRGLRVVGADEDAPLSYREADLRGPLALVVGSEGQGISSVVHRRLDLSVRIPMRGRIASLNAAVAGSILLFEAASQRGTPETDRSALAAADDAAMLAASRAPAAEQRTTEAAAEPKPEYEPAKPKRARKAKAATSTEPEPAAEPEAPLSSEAETVAVPAKPKRAARAKAGPRPTVVDAPVVDASVADTPVAKPRRAAKAKAESAPKVGKPAAKPKRASKARSEAAADSSDDGLLPEAPPVG